MFATLEETVDQGRERRREARRREVGAICEGRRVSQQRLTEIVREAEDDGDWQSRGLHLQRAMAGADLGAATTAPPRRSRAPAKRCASLPALDHALSTGALTLDQVAAAAECATPETDAELARIAVGKAPSAIALAARARPAGGGGRSGVVQAARAEHDLDARAARALLRGRLPLEQGAAFEQAIWRIAKPQRALDKQTGPPSSGRSTPPTRSSPSPAIRRRRRRHQAQPPTLIVHLSDDAPPLLEGAGPISPETAQRLACDARRLTIKPSGRDLVHSRVGAVPPTHSYARSTSAQAATASTPAAPQRTNSKPTTSSPSSKAAGRARQPHPALPPPPQTPPRPPHPHQRHRRESRLHRRRADARSPPTSHTHHPAQGARARGWRRLPGSRSPPGRLDQRVVVAPQAIV